MAANEAEAPDVEKIVENPFAGVTRLTAWLGESPLGLPGVPLALGGLLVVGLPRLLRRRGAPQRARAVRALGLHALGAAGLDLALMAGLPLLKLSYAPVRRAFFNLLLGRAALAGAGTALALAGALRRRDLRPGGRRLITGGSLAAHAVMGAGVVYSTYVEAQRLVVTRHTLHFPGRTPDAPALRLRLAHVSDIHIERVSRRDQATVDRLREAAPDLILLTGDYLSNDYTEDSRALTDLRRLLARIVALGPAHGVWAVLGNNDPPGPTRRVLDAAGVRTLDNRAVTLRLQGRRVQLLGARVGQEVAWEEDAPKLAAAAAQADAQIPAPRPDLRILLYHTPDLAPQAAAQGVDLYLCGHTHGGQIRLPGVGALRSGSRFGNRYALGLNSLPHGGYIYTTSGTGFEGLGLPRLRVLDPPEVAVFDLTVA
jgi:predicted MPP superfamily phosphohydrolase